MHRNTTNKIRLYVEAPLIKNREIELGIDDSHYICNVMRMIKGDNISCFNANDGEYDCKITLANKKHCQLEVLKQLKKPSPVADIWLLFSPLKKDKTDFVIEKATELGVSKIIPIITQNTITKKVKIERLIAQTKEAAEQCERTDMPEICQEIKLNDIITNWQSDRILFFMDESLEGKDCAAIFAEHKNRPSAIIVGPEGGFSPQEKELLDSQPFVKAVFLGPRVLRAETAVCASLSAWQAIAGDWKKGENK